MVGGLIVSQALTLFTTPVIYIYLDQLSNWLSRGKKRSVEPEPAHDRQTQEWGEKSPQAAE